MCWYFCTEFIDFVFNGKSLPDITSLFIPQNFEKNEKVILNYFFKPNISMNEPNVCDTIQICLSLDHVLQFRLSRIKERQNFLLQKSMSEKKWARHLSISQYLTMLTRLCLSGAGSGVSFLLIYFWHWYTCWDSKWLA